MPGAQVPVRVVTLALLRRSVALRDACGNALPVGKARLRPTKPDCSYGRYLSNSKATISLSPPATAMRTKRHFRHRCRGLCCSPSAQPCIHTRLSADRI
jgi:hypothetical protein